MPPQLFYENIYAALGEVIRATGGMKAVAAEMRPELDAVSAAGWLKDCLNPERREKLDPAQVLWLIRRGHQAGVHEIMRFIAQDVGYEPPRPISTEAQFASALDELKQMQEKMASVAGLVERLAKDNPDLLQMKRG